MSRRVHTVHAAGDAAGGNKLVLKTADVVLVDDVADFRSVALGQDRYRGHALFVGGLALWDRSWRKPGN